MCGFQGLQHLALQMNRKNEFEIQRGYYDEDEIEMNLPENCIVEASPNNVELKTKFGESNHSLK